MMMFAPLLCAGTLAVVDSSSSILDAKEVASDAYVDSTSSLHRARTRQSIESVSSAVRSFIHNEDSPDVSDNEHQRSASKNIQRRSRTRKQSENNKQIERDLIVGGSAAPPGRFPYVVSLQLEKVLDGSSSASSGSNNSGDSAEVSDVHTCGGTLIAMDVVLTAGHCGYEELPSSAVTSAQGSVNTDGHVNFGEMPTQIFYGADVGAYNLTSNDGGG